MANKILIKRRPSGESSAKPTSLYWGELAFNEASNTLYYGFGSGTTVLSDTPAIAIYEIGGSGSYSLRGGTNASGVWPISVTGNSSTVTSGVYSGSTTVDGNVATWLSASNTLGAGYVVSTDLSTNNNSSYLARADAIKTYVDNNLNNATVVRTTGYQTISGVKTFSSTIGGSINGNATTVTSGVTYTGSPTAGYIPKFTDFDTIENGYQISTNLSTNNGSSFIPRADAVKTYVDSVKQGLDIKDSVRFASTQSDDYDTEFGVGQFENVLTSNNVGVFSIDGRTPVVGDRILLKNQFVSQGPHQNGIYNVLDLGGPASFFKLERSTDANNNDKVNAGMFVFVTEGATNADTGWVAISDDPILLNENNVNFSQFSAAGQIYDGSGLYKQGNTIGVGQGDGITVGENGVAVNAGSGLTVDANGVHIGVNGGLTLNNDSISVDSTVVRTTSYTNGQLLIGNDTGNTLTKSTLTQGTAISITNGNGSITVAHGNTSNLTGTQASVGVANITVDEFGHVTSVTEATYVTSADLCTSISSCTIDGGTF